MIWAASNVFLVFLFIFLSNILVLAHSGKWLHLSIWRTMAFDSLWYLTSLRCFLSVRQCPVLFHLRNFFRNLCKGFRILHSFLYLYFYLMTLFWLFLVSWFLFSLRPECSFSRVLAKLRQLCSNSESLYIFRFLLLRACSDFFVVISVRAFVISSLNAHCFLFLPY